MKKYPVLLLLLGLFLSFKPKTSPVYELRIYHCEPGRLETLNARFRNHTTGLFEKHGMKNIGYWVPSTDAVNHDLYYILEHASVEAKAASWKAFIADPAWAKVRDESEKDGKIIKSIESIDLKLNPELTSKIKYKNKGPEALFEMRTYYILPNRYPNIVARFRDHTRKLFEDTGIKNVMYFDTIEKDGAQPKLLYFVAHKDAAAAKASWDTFRKNPKWIQVRDQSELSGKIVEKVVPVYLKPLDYSKMK
jgi:hypothetical protein